MSVPFFIGEKRLKTKIGKIGLASIFLLGLAVSHVAANETEVKASSEGSSIQTSSSKEEKKVEVSSSQQAEKRKKLKRRELVVKKRKANQLPHRHTGKATFM